MKFQGKDGTLRIYENNGGYLEVHFRNLDFSGALGRPKVDEILVLDNGHADKYAHYINPGNGMIFDPVPVSWSCFIDDITHVNTTNGFREIMVEALTCRDARNDQTDGTWTAYGTSTKGTTQNVSGTDNPKFETPTTYLESGSVTFISGTRVYDTAKSWVNGQTSGCMMKMTSGISAGKYFFADSSLSNSMEFSQSMGTLITVGDTYELYDNIRTVDVEFKLTGELNDIVWKYSECFFPLDEITLAESEDSINMSVTGGVYGTITRHADWVTP